MVARHDFSERPFVMGSLIGVRSFKVKEDDGHLYPPTYTNVQHKFVMGENRALCRVYVSEWKKRQQAREERRKQARVKVDSHTRFLTVDKETYALLTAKQINGIQVPTALRLANRRALQHLAANMGLPGEFNDPDFDLNDDNSDSYMETILTSTEKAAEAKLAELLRRIEEEEAKDPEPEDDGTGHRVGSKDCTCGFYAYLDEGQNPNDHDGNVLAIVEGYGVVTYGSRGFRAEKIKVLALIGYPQNGLTRFDEPDPEPGKEPRQSFWKTEAGIMLPIEQGDRLIPQRVVETFSGLPIFRTLQDAVMEYPLSPPNKRTENDDDRVAND